MEVNLFLISKKIPKFIADLDASLSFGFKCGAKPSTDEISRKGVGHSSGQKTTLSPSRNSQPVAPKKRLLLQRQILTQNTEKHRGGGCANGAAATSCRKNSKLNLRCENLADVSGSWLQPTAVDWPHVRPHVLNSCQNIRLVNHGRTVTRMQNIVVTMAVSTDACTHLVRAEQCQSLGLAQRLDLVVNRHANAISRDLS